MSKGHRTQIKRERNEKQVDKRPSAKLSNARVSSRKAGFVLDAIRGKSVDEALKLDADVATGATYSSEALIKNIKMGLQQAKGSSSKKADKAKAKSKGKAKGKKRMSR